MGFRGAAKTGGGGFLNNVDGKITGYTFTNKNISGEKGDYVYLVPQLAVDGSEKTITQHLFFGGLDRYSISKDGSELTNVDGGNVTFSANVPAGRFLISMLDNGLDEAELPDLEGGEPLNLSGIVGYRVRFTQEVDEKGTAKFGKRKYTTKDGREGTADRTNTVVSAVYGKEGGAKSAKPALAKGAKTANGDAIRDKADAAIVALIADAKDGKLPVAKINVGVIRQLTGDKDKDAVRTLAKSEAYLTDATERGVFVYDSDEDTVVAA